MNQPDAQPTEERKIRIKSTEPVLAVPDVTEAVDYYQKVLGFGMPWLWGTPPVHGGVGWDEVSFQFSLEADIHSPTSKQRIWVRVENIEGLAQKHITLGANILHPLAPQPWGHTDYTLQDLNGYQITFSEPQTGRPPREAVAAEVLIEEQMPTWEEMAELIEAVNWTQFTNFDVAPKVVETALYGVKATIEGKTVGCAVLTADGANFYYVRDVMVHPDWQGRRIGTKLMQALMDFVAKNAPDHTLLGLYTGRNLHEFYAQFGFRGPDHGLYGMSQVINRNQNS